MKISLIEIKRTSPDIARLRFEWSGTVPPSANWFVSLQNGEPEPQMFSLVTSRILMREIEIPVDKYTVAQIVVCASNGWRYTQSNSVNIEAESVSLKSKFQRLWHLALKSL